MVRGLYTAYTGLMNQQNRLDIITNNLANADTIAYKKEGATSQSFDSVLGVKIKDSSVYNINQVIGKLSLGVKIGESYTDYNSGSLEETGNTYDLAIEGDGFFAISFKDKRGNESTRYTRDGSFTVNNDGALVTKDGDYVLGQGGQITIPSGASEITIDESGNIYADGEFVDQLQMVDFEDYNYLQKYGENMYIAVDGATQKDASCKVDQGYLETSNVNVVSEMVEMISISRAFESNQKVINTIDETLEKSVNLGRI